MNTNTICGLGATLAMAFLSTTALADDNCPGVFHGKSCSGGSYGDNCDDTASDQVDCDVRGLVSGTATTGATAYFVSYSDTEFLAYGYDAQGEAFCCDFDGLDDGCDSGPHITVNIAGSDYNDTLYLVDTATSLALDCSDTYLDADMGHDNITGSPNTSNSDYLWGNGGADYITGLEGADHLYGGAGNDTIIGGDGADFIYGDDDADTITGGAGPDYIEGGAGPDNIKGGLGADEIYGDAGVDEICGDADADSIYGGDDTDYLEGNGTEDTVIDGGAGQDSCEQDNDVGCEIWPYTLNAACTW